MADGFCTSLYDLYEPEQVKVSQATLDLEQNTLKMNKFDNADSGGDDSDYSNDDKVPKKDGNPNIIQGNNQKEESKNNQILIKKKVNAQSLPAKKKK